MRLFIGFHENVVDVGGFLWVVQERQLLLVDRVDLRREGLEETFPGPLQNAVDEP